MSASNTNVGHVYSISEAQQSSNQTSTLSARCMTYMASMLQGNSFILLGGICLFVIGILRLSNWIKPYQIHPSALFRPPIV